MISSSLTNMFSAFWFLSYHTGYHIYCVQFQNVESLDTIYGKTSIISVEDLNPSVLKFQTFCVLYPYPYQELSGSGSFI